VLLRKADSIFVAVVLILVVLALVFGGQLIADPPLALSRDISPLNPRLFPTLVLAGTGLAAVIFLGSQAARGSSNGGIQRGEAISSGIAGLRRQLLFISFIVICALLLEHLGFLMTMFLLMAGTSLLVGNSSIVQILSVSIVVPFGFYVVVTHMLRTALPELDVIERALAPLIQLLPSF